MLPGMDLIDRSAASTHPQMDLRIAISRFVQLNFFWYRKKFKSNMFS